jgi:hypothetical protein
MDLVGTQLADFMVQHLPEDPQDHTLDSAVGTPLGDSMVAHLREGLQDHRVDSPQHTANRV